MDKINLLYEIEAAQRQAGIELDQAGGRGCAQVFKALPAAVQAAWRATKLPDELLTITNLSLIARQAQQCGITLAAAVEQE
jgi:hypothetical protein